MGHFTHVYDTTHGVIGYPDLVWVPGEGESVGITHDSSGNPLPDYKPDNAPEEGGGTLNIDLHCKNKVKGKGKEKKECGYKEKITLVGLNSFFA